MTIPFERRVFPALYPSIGRKGALVVYCPASNMNPDLVERLVWEAEQAIEEPVRHTLRKCFPEKLTGSIAEEVAQAWKAPKRVLMLCNPLSRPTQVTITANRFPCAKNGAYPADYGVLSIEIGNSAPRALDLLARLPRFAALSGAFMARADSPDWRESMVAVTKERELGPQSLSTAFRFVSEEGWGISERFGWGTYVGPRCAREFGALCAPETIERLPDGGAIIWVTAQPFDFRNESHYCRYIELKKELAAHMHDGTQIGEFLL
jgi:hypothetical protein